MSTDQPQRRKKPRSDSKLKGRALESHEWGEKVWTWCHAPKSAQTSGGLAFARERLSADGIKTSLRALSEFCAWWELRQDFSDLSRDVQNIQDLLKKSDAKLSAAQIDAAGQLIFTQRALAKRDPQEFREMEKLRLQKEAARASERLESGKLALAERRVAMLESKMAEAREKLNAVAKKGGISRETMARITEAAKLL